MVKENSILKNTSFLMAGTFLQRVLSLFTTVIITRFLGPEHYGQLTFIIALVTIVSVFWDFGLNTLFVRDVSRDKDLSAEYSGNVIALKAFLLLLVFPVMLIYLKLLDYSEIIVISAICFASGQFISTITGIFESVFSAWKRLDYSAILNVLRAAVLLALVIVVVKYSTGLLGIVLCYSISFLVVFLIALILLKHSFVLPSFRGVKFRTLWNLIVRASPFLLTSVVSIILFKIDHLMISKITGDVELGLYGAAYTLLEIIISFFPMIIMRSTFPVLCEMYHKDIDAMASLFNKLFRILLFFGLPISCGTFLLGTEFMSVIFGKDYTQAGPLLSVLGGSVCVFFLTHLMGWTITAMDRQKLVLTFGVVSMVVNICINLIFIPLWGALGAAIATLLSEMVQLLCMGTLLWKTIHLRFNLWQFKTLISAGVMSLVIIFMKQVVFVNDIIKLLCMLAAAVVTYLLLSSIFKVISYNEMKNVLRSW